MLAFKRSGAFACGSLLLGMAACGGRTGELDGYEYDTNSSLPSDAGSSPAGRAGSSSSSGGGGSGMNNGAAGSAQAGSPSQAGAAGASGTDVISVVCSDLCVNPELDCPGQLGPPADCLSACGAALSVRSGACTAVGSDFVRCFSNVLKKYSPDCSTGESQAALQCAGVVSAYQVCASSGTSSPPIPQPNCSGTGGVSPGKCFENAMCANGQSYQVTCDEIAPDQSSCLCNASSGSTAKLALAEGAMYACDDAMTACAVPGLPK